MHDNDNNKDDNNDDDDDVDECSTSSCMSMKNKKYVLYNIHEYISYIHTCKSASQTTNNSIHTYR
jgi:hypothetical protein